MPSPSSAHRRRFRRRWHETPCGGGDMESCVADVLAAWDVAALQWSAVEDQLAHCALTALQRWCCDGSIYMRVRRVSRKRLRLTAEQLSDSEGLSELIGTVVAVSLHHFRRKAFNNTGWTPQHRIGVLDYFLGQCLLKFPSEHQRWARSEFPSNTPPLVPLYRAMGIPATDLMSRPADLAVAFVALRCSASPQRTCHRSRSLETPSQSTSAYGKAGGPWVLHAAQPDEVARQTFLSQDRAAGHPARVDPLGAPWPGLDLH